MLPYVTVSCCEAETGKPGADCAAASAMRAPKLRVVFAGMLFGVSRWSFVVVRSSCEPG